MKALKAIYIIAIFVVTAVIITFFAARRFGFFKGGESMVEETVSTSPFTAADIEADILNLRIEEGEEYAVEYAYPASLVPSIKMDGDTVVIKSHGKNGFHVSFGNGRDGNNLSGTRLVLIVPKGTDFKELKVEADAGNINIEGYTFDRTEIECDAANVNFNEVTSAKTTIDSDAGNIQIRDSALGKCKLSADAGNIEVKDSTMETLEVETDLGNVDLRSATFEKGEMSSSMGRIAVDGTFEELKAESDLGSISVDSEDIKDTKLDLSVSLGSITVDGKQKGKSYQQ